MKYSRTGEFCLFDIHDFALFRESRNLYAFREFLKKNNARCIDDSDTVYTESEYITEAHTPWCRAFTGLSDDSDSDLHYRSSSNTWHYCYCKNPGTHDIRKLYNLTCNDITCIKPDDDKGGCTMASVNESFKTVLSMKMLKGIMKNGDADLGKLYLMQQMTNGQPLQVTDVIKSKLINEFALDKDGDLPLEKVLLLQMLDSGSIDLSQLIMFKMMGSLLDEDSDKKKE